MEPTRSPPRCSRPTRTGPAKLPQPNADGTLDFEMTGLRRTANVHVEPIAPTSGAEIVGFTIEYT